MSDEKKIRGNEGQFLAELDACRTGEEHDLSGFTELTNSLKNQTLDDLEQISSLFRGGRPGPDEIPESVDNFVLAHIKQKSREIKREQKVVRIFPRYKWAAAAVMGVLVCVVSFNLIYKIEKPTDSAIKDNTTPILTELSRDEHERNRYVVKNEQAANPGQVNVDSLQVSPELKKATAPVNSEHKDLIKTSPARSAGDIDGNGRVNIIDAYLMDRRLMSGVAMPKNMDLNGDGNIDREDINTIVKTAVSLGKGEV